MFTPTEQQKSFFSADRDLVLPWKRAVGKTECIVQFLSRVIEEFPGGSSLIVNSHPIESDYTVRRVLSYFKDAIYNRPKNVITIGKHRIYFTNPSEDVHKFLGVQLNYLAIERSEGYKTEDLAFLHSRVRFPAYIREFKEADYANH